jgi:hypothetical protein
VPEALHSRWASGIDSDGHAHQIAIRPVIAPLFQKSWNPLRRQTADGRRESSARSPTGIDFAEFVSALKSLKRTGDHSMAVAAAARASERRRLSNAKVREADCFRTTVVGHMAMRDRGFGYSGDLRMARDDQTLLSEISTIRTDIPRSFPDRILMNHDFEFPHGDHLLNGDPCSMPSMGAGIRR